MEFTEKIKAYQDMTQQSLGSRAAARVWHDLRAMPRSMLFLPCFSCLGSAGKEWTSTFPFTPQTITWEAFSGDTYTNYTNTRNVFNRISSILPSKVNISKSTPTKEVNNFQLLRSRNTGR
jgi:hypothetical protein